MHMHSCRRIAEWVCCVEFPLKTVLVDFKTVLVGFKTVRVDFKTVHVDFR